MNKEKEKVLIDEQFIKDTEQEIDINEVEKDITAKDLDELLEEGE